MSIETEANGILPDNRIYGVRLPFIGCTDKKHLPNIMNLVNRNVTYTEGEPAEVMFDASIPAIGVVEEEYLPDIVGLMKKNTTNSDEDGIVFPNGKIYNVVILAVGIQNKKHLPKAMELIGKNTVVVAPQSKGAQLS